MISLSSLQAPTKRPLITTIGAEGGLGKTSLAALWPSPVFIRTEDGSRSIEDRQDIALFPIASTRDMVIGQLEALIREDHDFRTLAFDSVTKYDTILRKLVLDNDPKAKSINQAMGGYGAGESAVAAYHQEVRQICQYLADTKGMHIVFIAHTDTETINLPDQEEFSRYTIRMHKKSVSCYTDDVDLIAFIKLQTFTSGGADGKKSRATTSGQRIITCYPTPAHVSKNRLGIKSDLVFTEGVNPFAEYLV